MIVLILFTICQFTLLIMNHMLFQGIPSAWNQIGIPVVAISFFTEAVLVINSYRNSKNKVLEQKKERLEHELNRMKMEEESAEVQAERLNKRREDLLRIVKEAENDLHTEDRGSAAAKLQKEIEKNQVDLSFSGLSVPLTIEVNIDQMGKALSQILDNSIYAVLKKAGEPGYQPSVSLVLRIQADKLQVVIRDNGVGIEETIKTKVFSPFFTTKPTAEAAGTGLYLSREVVLNHKGTIAIESEKDKYTEVTITLPIYS